MKTLEPIAWPWSWIAALGLTIGFGHVYWMSHPAATTAAARQPSAPVPAQALAPTVRATASSPVLELSGWAPVDRGKVLGVTYTNPLGGSNSREIITFPLLPTAQSVSLRANSFRTLTWLVGGPQRVIDLQYQPPAGPMIPVEVGIPGPMVRRLLKSPATGIPPAIAAWSTAAGHWLLRHPQSQAIFWPVAPTFDPR